jgi:hypothetical protein
MAEPILNAPGVVARIGQRVAAGMAEHVNVNRKGEAGARADALDEFVDRIGRERAAALGGEHEGRDAADHFSSLAEKWLFESGPAVAGG